MNSIFLIAVRVLASPLVNVFQKKLTNQNVSPELIVMMSYLFFVLISIPLFIIIEPFDLPGEFWLFIILFGVFDILGNMFLVRSIKVIDLSVFGPLNAYKPVFALIFSGFILDEIPSFVGILGVLIIVIGSYMLGYPNRLEKRALIDLFWNKGILFRMLAIALASVAAVFAKKTILLSSPLVTLMYWSVIGWPISLFILMKINSNWINESSNLSGHKWQLALLFLSFLALQLFTLLTFEKVYVGYALAFFQLSSVVSVFFGFHFFKERNFRYRLIGSLIMVLGAFLIVMYG